MLHFFYFFFWVWSVFASILSLVASLIGTDRLVMQQERSLLLSVIATPARRCCILLDCCILLGKPRRARITSEHREVRIDQPLQMFTLNATT
jgi:hypothetical protein